MDNRIAHTYNSVHRINIMSKSIIFGRSYGSARDMSIYTLGELKVSITSDKKLIGLIRSRKKGVFVCGCYEVSNILMIVVFFSSSALITDMNRNSIRSNINSSYAVSDHVNLQTAVEAKDLLTS